MELCVRLAGMADHLKTRIRYMARPLIISGGAAVFLALFVCGFVQAGGTPAWPVAVAAAVLTVLAYSLSALAMHVRRQERKVVRRPREHEEEMVR